MKISKTTYNKYKKVLLEKGIIKKREIPNTNKKIPQTLYSLTTKGKKDYSLRILDIQSSINKNRVLYQLLLFFEYYKRSNIITEIQFKNFLKKIEIKFENMEQMNREKFEQIKQDFPFDVTNSYITYNNISICEFRNSSNYSKYYYVVLPGFTIDEFLDYLELVKTGKEPQPFAQFPTRIQIPYIHYLPFSKEEVVEAIELLRINGIIRPILDIYRGESRYDISNEILKEILSQYWFLHICDFYISFQRIMYEKKPSDADKEYMKLYFGEHKLERKLAFIYDLRKKNKEEFEKEILEKYGNIEELKVIRNKILENIQKNTRLLKENDIYILSLVKEIFLNYENII